MIHDPHQMSDHTEFFVIERRLRSICSVIISRLRSAVRLLFSSIVFTLFDVTDLVYLFSGLAQAPAERLVSTLCVRITVQR